jgi:hypothetical protein
MKSPHSSERHLGDAASVMVLTLLTLMAGGDRAFAASHEIPSPDVRIKVSLGDRSDSSRLLREIEDPNSGMRWLLMRDKSNPGGPGRLELVPPERDPGTLERRVQAPSFPRTRAVWIIRAGDRLVVEEHSATTDAYLDGIALGPAGTGSALNVRLSIGGRVVRAVAMGPGRAAIEAAAGGRR